MLFLIFELKPLIDIGVMHADLGTHFGESSDKNFGAAISGVAYIFSIRGSQDENFRASNGHAHIAQGVSDELGCVEGTGIINVNGERGHPEGVVFKTKDVTVYPICDGAVTGPKTVALSAAGPVALAGGGNKSETVFIFLPGNSTTPGRPC